jgi:hypothetical protein
VTGEVGDLRGMTVTAWASYPATEFMLTVGVVNLIVLVAADLKGCARSTTKH